MVACGLLAGLLIGQLVGQSAGAANVSGMYEAAVAPPGKGERASAVTLALRQVAVRVSGSRDAATRIEERGDYDLREVKPDGTVRIGFDRQKVEQLLIKHNLPIWGRERPATLVWLRIGDGNWITAGSSGPERDAVERAAQVRGMPLIWPAMDIKDLETATSLVSSHTVEQLSASAARYRADAVLLGIKDAAGSMQFSFVYDDVLAEQVGTLEDGVHLAADRCAKVLAVPASARSEVKLRVAGVSGLEQYARTLNYLEDLSVVRAVAIEQLQTDVLDMRVEVRGDAAVLRKTIALDRRLEPDRDYADGTDGAMSFRFVN